MNNKLYKNVDHRTSNYTDPNERLLAFAQIFDLATKSNHQRRIYIISTQTST